MAFSNFPRVKNPECTRPFSGPCIICWVLIPRASVFCSLFCEEEESLGAAGPIDSLQWQGFPKGQWGDSSPVSEHAVVREGSSENVWLADLCLHPAGSIDGLAFQDLTLAHIGWVTVPQDSNFHC